MTCITSQLKFVPCIWPLARGNKTPMPKFFHSFVQIVEERQGLKVACPEEIAFRMGFIDAAQLQRLAEPLARNGYGRYLLQVLDLGAAG